MQIFIKNKRLVLLMKEVIKKEILYDLTKAIGILEQREAKDVEKLKVLSDHAIEDVALHKDLDLISVTVLIYSLYKIGKEVPPEDYKDILAELKFAKDHLESGNLGRYNKSIRSLFGIIRKCNAKIRVHLQDVMQAARIKKGTVLLEKGLSIGQAAGLMGLSNWDLQQYAGRTTVMEQHHESTPAKKRLLTALDIFGVD